MRFSLQTILTASKFRDWIITLFIPLAVLPLYISSLAPTIVAEGDGAEFAACAAVNGIPHKPGYPTYMLLCRMVSFFAAQESLIRSMNLMSALFGAATLGILYAIIRTRGISPVWAAVSALMFGAGEIYWTQSLIAEVYTPLAFVLACILLVLFRWGMTGENKLLPVAAAFLGLGYGIHKALLPLTLLPAAYVLVKKPVIICNAGLIALCLLVLIAGSSTYVYLPLTAQKSPAVNIENPDTIEKMLQQLSFNPLRDERSIPQSSSAKKDYTGMLRSLYGHWKSQYPAAVTIIGVLGLLVSLLRRTHTAEDILVLGIFFATTVGFMFCYPFDPDSGFAHEYRVMYIPAMMVFMLWLAEGLCFIEKTVRTLCLRLPHMFLYYDRYGKAIMAAVCIAAVCTCFAYRLPLVDKSDNYFSYDYGRNLLDSMPRGALFCTTGDNAIFPLIYLQLVERVRTDVAVVHLPLAKRPWYQKMVMQADPGVLFDNGDFNLEFFLKMNTARRPAYTSLSLEQPPAASRFRLDPAGLVFRIMPKDENVSEPAAFRPKFLHGVFNAAIPKDLREMSILCDYPQANLFSGNYFLKNGRYDDALREYEQGLAYPLLFFKASRIIRSQLLNNMGVVYYHLNRQADSAAAWREAAALDPENPHISRNLERIRLQQESSAP